MNLDATFGESKRATFYNPPANSETIGAGGKHVYEMGGTYRVVIGPDTVDVVKDGGDYGDYAQSAPRTD